MKKAGDGYFICHGRKFRLFEEESKLESFLAPSGTTAPSTISLSEVLANVGITEEWHPIGTVRRAREKIRVYPYVGDTQAPLAGLRSL